MVNQKSMDNSVSSSNVERKKRDCSGQNNGFYGKKHTQQTKNLMSQKAKDREAQYKKWKDSQHHISMDEFLSNNPTVEQYIKALVRESIEKYIWKDQIKQRISIPL